MNAPPTARVPDRTHRLIPSRFPPIQAFASVSTPEDLAAVMELEGWTNDRLVEQRLARLPKEEWIFGAPNASVIMASFLHAAPAGLRFTSPGLGAWYASLAVNTAIAEVVHHLRREMAFASIAEMHVQYRTYEATLAGDYADIRGTAAGRSDLYDKTNYARSQVFGESVRVSTNAGILYDSVRHAGGVNAVCFRPRKVHEILQTTHYELTVRMTGKIIVRTL